jgi:hypothetical protein
MYGEGKGRKHDVERNQGTFGEKNERAQDRDNKIVFRDADMRVSILCT